MNQHIDVKRITDAVYIEDQSNLKLEFPVHSDSLYLLESGVKRKFLQTHVYLMSLKLITCYFEE